MIRPTADRIREAIFNILGEKVLGADILDIFAGTGAFGIEALSRGARTVTFVENEKYAVTIIERNIRACKLEEVTNILKIDAVKNLHYLKYYDHQMDLIFIDPPYEKGMIVPTLKCVVNFCTIKKDSVIVVEHSISEKIPQRIRHLQLYDQRKYGNTLVSFLSTMLYSE